MVDRIMRIVGIIIFLVLPLGSALHAAEPSLRVSLELEQDSYLPAYPIHATITISNVGSRNVSAPKGGMVLRVQPEGEPAFIVPGVVAGEPIMVSLPEGSLRSSLKPGETVSVDFALGDQLGADFLYSERLWAPGRYFLQVAFLDESIHEWELLDPVAIESLLRTNTVPLTIEAPAGNDALAWNMILQSNILRQASIKERSDVARELWKTMPPSRYSPHVGRIILPRGDAERNAIWGEVIRMDKEGHVRDDLRIVEAVIDFQNAAYELKHGPWMNRTEAIQQAEEARARLIKLADKAVTGNLRLKAATHIQTLPSREYLLEQASRDRAAADS